MGAGEKGGNAREVWGIVRVIKLNIDQICIWELNRLEHGVGE
jgi:hypothetical protein